MTNNILNYLKADAVINFDAELMMFVGEVEAMPEPIVFAATDIESLQNEYDKAVDAAQEQAELLDIMTRELVSVPTKSQPGEAEMQIYLNETDERLGKMIKMMLFMTGGAGFYLSEKMP